MGIISLTPVTLVPRLPGSDAHGSGSELRYLQGTVTLGAVSDRDIVQNVMVFVYIAADVVITKKWVKDILTDACHGVAVWQGRSGFGI